MKTSAGLLVIIAVLGILGTACAEPAPSPRLAPDSFFIKTGLAKDTAAFSLGVGWDQSDWLWSSLPDSVSLTFEGEVGHWQAFHPRHEQVEFIQFGVTPLLRFPLAASARCTWFVEGGVGFYFIVPRYRTHEKRFSTSFNFQDLIGLGLRCGEEHRHEVAFYVSHFSNAGIKEPNPGENFLQLRYLWHFD